MDALTTPLFKSILFATIVASAGFTKVMLADEDTSVTRRLALHAEVKPEAIYMTAWREGDVMFTFPDAKLHPITFYNRATTPDGCKWLATETLTPIDETTFHYDYNETIISCEGPPQWVKTPRSGLVTVVE